MTMGSKTALLFAATSLVLGIAGPAAAAADIVAAVTSQRQAGSVDFQQEQRRPDSEPVALEIVYKADLPTGLGGAYRGEVGYVDNLDLKITFAGERALGLPGATVFAHLLRNHGAMPNKQVGTLQGIGNIEVETNTGKLLQLWYPLVRWQPGRRTRARCACANNRNEQERRNATQSIDQA